MIDHKSYRTPLLILGILLAGSGAIAIGGWQLIKFVKKINHHEALALPEWIVHIILPHIAILCGLALIIGGVILAIRYTIVQKRLKHKAL